MQVTDLVDVNESSLSEADLDIVSFQLEFSSRSLFTAQVEFVLLRRDDAVLVPFPDLKQQTRLKQL